jgi:hypothetical protein
MRARHVVWETNDRRVVAVPVVADSPRAPYCYVVERKTRDSMDHDAWVHADAGSSEHHAGKSSLYPIFAALDEANASKPVRLSKGDARLLSIARTIILDASASVGTDDERAELQKLLHRLHMLALRQPQQEKTT